ncbi:MAG: hypothetical protein BJ554DRAFT_5051 [Olpidium bornovanus]|uniref:Uncharacterized protein n=1 Tax=Olpidium bornovanus TaxID=278681 RepID=A0A8H8DER4_9FUNG|nr:MAG: hypothetical protein BJ554DRAFT_5051 [Olpidium bornovanus]
MHFFDFIFLSRKWEEDRGKIDASLGRVTGEETKNEPMWLLIFPEGTVVSQSTRTRSREWAEKMNVVRAALSGFVAILAKGAVREQVATERTRGLSALSSFAEGPPAPLTSEDHRPDFLPPEVAENGALPIRHHDRIRRPGARAD